MNQNSNKIEKSSKKSEKNLKDSPLPPLPFAHHIKTHDDKGHEKKLKQIAHKEGALSVDEALELMANMEKKQAEIKHKLNEMYKQRGMTPEYLKTYMSNPSNFSPEEWKEMESKRQTFINSIPTELKEEAGVRSFHSVSDTSSASKNPKERRSKLAGAHRRNWLPIR